MKNLVFSLVSCGHMASTTVVFSKGKFVLNDRFGGPGCPHNRKEISPSEVARLIIDKPAGVKDERLFNCQNFPEALCAVCETFDVAA